MSSSVTRPSKKSILKKKRSQTDWSHDTKKFIKKIFFEKKKKPLQYTTRQKRTNLLHLDTLFPKQNHVH
jgi:hypothetical protein